MVVPGESTCEVTPEHAATRVPAVARVFSFVRVGGGGQLGGCRAELRTGSADREGEGGELACAPAATETWSATAALPPSTQ